jgi:hypothetical protein
VQLAGAGAAGNLVTITSPSGTNFRVAASVALQRRNLRVVCRTVALFKRR